MNTIQLYSEDEPAEAATRMKKCVFPMPRSAVRPSVSWYSLTIASKMMEYPHVDKAMPW